MRESTLRSARRARGIGRRLRAFAAVAVAAVTLTTAPLGTPVQAHANDETTLNVALVNELDTLNPFLGTLSVSLTINRAQYEPLVAWAPTDNTEYPAIAESWETSDSATTWTYHLQQDAKWSDGEAITAEDVVWTYTAILENDGLKTAFGGYVSNIKSVSAPDDHTVVIELKTPQSSNPGTDVFIVPEHVWSKLDSPETYKNDKEVVGSGPFTVVSSSSASGVSMKANPHYRGGEAQVKFVNWRPYRNTDAAVQALRSGEIDALSGLTSAQFDAIKSVPEITAIAGDGRGMRGIQINPGATDANDKPMGDGHEVLKDKTVRQAIVHAIDRQVLVDRVLQGYGQAATGIVPPMYPENHLPEDDPGVLKFDPELANKMLDEAGYKRGPDGIRLDKNGKPIELRLESYDHGSAQQTLDFLKRWLQDIGIKTKTAINSMAQYNDDTVLGTYDIYISGWTVRPNPDNLFLMNRCDSRPNSDGSGATSLANYCDAEYDKLQDQMMAAKSPEERAEKIKELQVHIEQAAVFPVFFYPAVFEAYRSDRFVDLVQQPNETGTVIEQYGAWGIYSAVPANQAQAAGGNSGPAGPSIMLWIALGIAVIGLVLQQLRIRKLTNNLYDEE